MTLLQIALGLVLQSCLQQLGAVHVTRHQQHLQAFVQAVRTIELVEQRPGRQALAGLKRQGQSGHQPDRQQQTDPHASSLLVENT